MNSFWLTTFMKTMQIDFRILTICNIFVKFCNKFDKKIYPTEAKNSIK